MKRTLRGVELDSMADVALPFLMIACVTAAVSAVAAAFGGMAGFPFLPSAGFWALLVATESFLFTLVFFVREVDMPHALRWVEVAVMALLVKVLVTLPLVGGLAGAVTGGGDRMGTWFGAGLLGWAWWFGWRTAHVVAPLHPVLARRQMVSGMERQKHNFHGEAYDAIKTQLLGMLGAVGLVAGAVDWARGNRGFWGWTGVSVSMLFMAVAVLGALMAAARLRQQVTWLQESMEPPDAVLEGWTALALPLLLTPLALAMLLPAGPRLPVEWLLRQARGREETGTWFPPEPAQPEAPRENPLLTELQRLSGPAVQWPPWLGSLLYALLGLVVLSVVVAVVSRAARQLAERAGWEELKGFWALLAALAAIWLALLGSLGAAARTALQGPAEALGAALGEAGALGRFLPFTGRPPAEPRAAVRFYFARLLAAAARRRLRRAPGATAAEFGAQLGAALPGEAAEVERLTRAYEAARYSPDPMDPEAAGMARRAWQRIARALARRK